MRYELFESSLQTCHPERSEGTGQERSVRLLISLEQFPHSIRDDKPGMGRSLFLLLQKILLQNPVPPPPSPPAGFGVQVSIELQQVAARHLVEEMDEAEGEGGLDKNR